MLFKYSVGDSDQIFEYESESIFSIPITQFECEELLEEIAQDYYYYDHDGSEDEWPITLKLFDKNNKLMGEGKIELEYEPTYYTLFKKAK